MSTMSHIDNKNNEMESEKINMKTLKFHVRYNTAIYASAVCVVTNHQVQLF